MTRAGGFTLIEMLLVVALLGATAMVSMALVGGRDQQARRQTTERRLDALVEAVVGRAAPAWGGEVRLAGFVAENGRLPASVLELTARASLVDADECRGDRSVVAAGLMPCLRPRAPVFDPTPAADGRSDGSGDEFALDDPAESLNKGLRRQLDGQAGGDLLRDGWGNVSLDGDADDALNHGWRLGLPADENADWTITSLGSDNAVGTSVPPPDDEATADLVRAVAPDDWSVDLVGWTVRVHNAGAGAIPAGSALAVSLLVWETASGGGRWRRHTTPASAAAIDAGGSADFVFAAPTSATTRRIPNGEHRVLLVAGSTPYAVGGRRVHAAARFYPRAARPVIELVVR
ncbi:type II secretion system protein [Rubrivivax gelatinosus]|uniref:Prepilin-type N-terminal cleavage/methylation domain-containing protein n=1 Tax=Rubrivivax gelatinosus TaxID=28068 RepID=A0A4R2MAI1_RUBGE|nr:type II secretion system protein [Rubrivivax gelatinosus]MBK1689719.1 hypothetical protein [Rubrivivax gelatinosus]TCP01517.1 prepilin-type N-terminal cleavage/methylation domain-containing protein [Rubrivivax gelatinosus]